ncbi:MAG: hemin-degrading factor [Rhodovulum sulfidophilum]|uniref:Hemin-degrading factor n=1 Tax=Rhodovulum sulfidophilum TaxID=35806 RepID=A0A2W5PS33_RHOSU|nr:MAG: hemin-degrading factor [Rhodovulum sulfidophilum]
MSDTNRPTAEALRAARIEHPGTRDRDLAAEFGVSEAELVAAHLGHGAVSLAPHPDRLVPALEALGPLMALTRNESCVIEKTGPYAGYKPGANASFIAAGEIDLRFFPSHWVYAFAVERETERGTQRSIQVFDAAGDAVHKVYPRPESTLSAWAPVVDALRVEAPALQVTPRTPVEGPSGDPARAPELREAWARMTDTHQFLTMAGRLRMNRLGAYRVAAEPLTRRLAPGAIAACLEAAAGTGTPIMVFVGNRGCIEIHTGPIHRVATLGPWLNILDPGLDLHLRADHVAEVWAVDKPTRRGAALSVECFDAQGMLIAQFFGVNKAGPEALADWRRIVDAQPTLAETAEPARAAG